MSRLYFNPVSLVPLLALITAVAVAQEPPQRPVLPAAPPVRRPVQAPGSLPARPAILPAATSSAEEAAGESETALKFDGASADIVLKAYAEATGRTLLLAPDVPKATISLMSQSELTREEFLQAIETTLVMHGIALQPVDEKFLKVLPAKDLRKLGVKTEFEEPGSGKYVEDGKMVSQMIALKSITIEEARKAIEGFKRGDGQIHLFERTNSILITDTVDNVNRIMEIIKYIDQPLVNREETNIRPILHAKAVDIKKRLEEIIAEQQKEQQQAKTAPEAATSGAPGIQRRTLPAPAPVPGVIRPGRAAAGATTPQAAENEIVEALVADAERGVIRGKVQIIADERTNLLIILTRPENMLFFDKIINVLDVEVETVPDVTVKVMRLEYAAAKDVATMINDLIGSPKKEDTQSVRPAADARDTPRRSETLAEAAARTSERPRRDAPSGTTEARPSKVGELNSDDIKILADERTNALIIMASPSDIAVLTQIIKDMDIMLSQVLIETVVLEVGLSDKLETGIDWVQRTLIAGRGDRTTAYAGRGGGGSLVTTDILAQQTPPSGGHGITYYATFFGLNVDTVLHASSSDSRTRTLASPVLLTMDNVEATIEATQDQYFFKGKRYAGTQVDGRTAYEDDVEIKSVGITVKVTPRINEKGFIVMKVDEKIQNIAGTQRINDGDWPIVASRNLSAEVAVQSGQTIVLGGLVQNSSIKTRSKIPLLGDIPYLGRLFRYDSNEEKRNEVMIFLTPYVMDSQLELDNYARQRKAAADLGDTTWQQGASISTLADPPDKKTMKRLEQAGLTTDREEMEQQPIQILQQPQPILYDETVITTNHP